MSDQDATQQVMEDCDKVETTVDDVIGELEHSVSTMDLSPEMEGKAMDECTNCYEYSVVRLGEETIKCRTALLCQHSRHFADRYQKDSPFFLKGLSMDIFVLVYCWMRSQPGDNVYVIRPRTVLQILRAAQSLEISVLEEECMRYLRPGGVITERNAFVVFLEALKMGDSEIKSYMVSRIATYFLPMVATEEFLKLCSEDVTLFFSSDKIKVHCEFEVYMAAVKWLSHDWATRRNDVMTVMSAVRLELISPLHLLEIKYPMTPEFLTIIEDPRMQILARDALWISAILHTLGGGDNSLNISQPLRYYDCIIRKPRDCYLSHKLYKRNMYQSFCVMLLKRQIASMEEENRELDAYRLKLNLFLGEDDTWPADTWIKEQQK